MKKKLRKFFKLFGPGFITGASDDDPSGIATYAQTGAIFGYGQLWTALFSFPFMTVMQEMCGRIGLVTGKGLSGVIRRHYSKTLLYGAVLLLLVANSINIGANLGAMAASIRLLVDVPFVFLLLLITAITLILEIFITYRVYARYLKYLTLALLAYVATAFVVRQDWSTIAASTFLPSISPTKEYLMNIVAILGTTISPYLFFWQTSEEVEEEVAEKKLRIMGMGKPRLNARAISRMRLDTVFGMLFSNLIMFFIILTTASTLHLHGISEIQTAAQAAEALRPLAGDFAFLIFALGIVGAGFLAVPVLAGSASYALAEAFGWREGLYLKLKQAHGFYGVITIATLLGLLINFTPITSFEMLYYTAILNGIVAPPLMIIIMLISNNKKIMGKHTNTRVSNVLG
ncbi:iron transporter [Candidatus Falkowbacteria bacterium RIFOXYA2_FULL_47_9]|nr:MAG: iron transporter [Candidatus Falkowbacteria bacterium RIFOXYA2_FULL_47_9]